VLCATPTFAMRLAQVAREMGVDPSKTSIKFTIGGGEPGPFALSAMRKSLDEMWGARSCDQMGIAEIDAFGTGDPARDGVLVNEMNVFCWSVDPDTLKEVPDGRIGENIVTSYVNSAQPLINYRTHDLVRRVKSNSGGRTWAKFEGVVLGRTDFMVTVRGTNVYPTAVQNLLGEVPGVSQHYQLVLTRENEMERMTILFEPEASVPEADWNAVAERAQSHIHGALRVRLETEIAKPGTLPRYELKTTRIVDKRPKEFRRALDR